MLHACNQEKCIVIFDQCLVYLGNDTRYDRENELELVCDLSNGTISNDLV